MDMDQATMYHIVRNNTSKALSAQVNGDVNFNFGEKTIKERIKGALVKKIGPSPRKKEVNPETCKWLGEIPNFLSWNSNDANIPGLLWIYGGPGKGKTHLATHLASQLRKSDMVLNYFCDARDILRSTELAVALGLLNQLLESENSENLYRITSDKFSGIEQDLFSDAYIADLWDCLEMIIRKISQNHRVYLVLDGLDQCDSSSKIHLTSQLRRMCNENRQEETNPVKVVIFSRPSDLHRQTDLIIDLHEDEIVKWTEEDIRRIVKDSCLLQQGEMEYCDILTKRANGTFLWVALAISLLDNKPVQQKIVDGDSAFLDKLLPSELEAMYNMMLLNILQLVHGKFQCKEIMEIFRCLAISSHPLTKDEVEAITVLDGPVVDDALQAFQDILSITGKGSSNKAVGLIHSSLKELFVQDSLSLIPKEICWSIWPILSSTASWLGENRFQLWLLDYAVLIAMSVYFQEHMYQHPTLIFGFLFCLLQFVSQAPRSSLLMGLFYKAFGRLIDKTTMMIFSVREKEARRFEFKRCIASTSDRDKGLRRGMCGAGHPGPLESKTKAEEPWRLLRYPCRYWVHHLERSYPNSYEIETVYAFAKKHFLHWLETISIFGVISEAVWELNIVQEVIQVSLRSILVLSSLIILVASMDPRMRT
ncbi:unnamed protein product [Penicillium palitans]